MAINNALDDWFESRTLSPFRDLAQIQDSFDLLLNEFMNLKRANGTQELAYNPACDIIEEEGRYIFKLDIPGVTKDQLKVEVMNSRILIQAERKEEKSSEESKKYLSELCYGIYSRTFDLPESVDLDKMEAKFENGVLSVMIPKSEPVKMKQIPIH